MCFIKNGGENWNKFPYQVQQDAEKQRYKYPLALSYSITCFPDYSLH
jgi:hypothetical protein